jgi:hypothetical protein
MVPLHFHSELSEYLHRHAADNVCGIPSVQNLDINAADTG